MAIEDGGSAFPATYEEYDQDSERWRVVSGGGMSLRDYFAAKAMVGIYQMIATGSHSVNANDIEGGIADLAYLMADAMLRARQQ